MLKRRRNQHHKKKKPKTRGKAANRDADIVTEEDAVDTIKSEKEYSAIDEENSEEEQGDVDVTSAKTAAAINTETVAVKPEINESTENNSTEEAEN